MSATTGERGAWLGASRIACTAMTTPLTELADERASRVARRLAGLAGQADERAVEHGPIRQVRVAAAGALAAATLLTLVAARGPRVAERNPVRELTAAGSLSGTPQADLYARQRVPTRDAPELPAPGRGSSSTMKMQSAAAIAATVLTASANCADIRVPQDVATIQGAIDAAQAGDRVLVGPGTYREQVNLSGKRVIVLGVAGAASTILDGEGNRTVVLGQNEPAGCELSGFTIQNGSGDLAGGMLVTNSAVNVHDCVFRSNTASNWYGGAGFRSEGGAPVVTDCRFIQNRGLSNSTASSWYHFGTGTFDLRRCTFDGNINTDSGVTVKVNPEFQAVNGSIRDCVFVGPQIVGQDKYGWGCIYFHAVVGTVIEVNGCRFAAPAGGQYFAVAGSLGSTVRVVNCSGCGFTDPIIFANGATGEVTGSTFVPACTDCNSNGIPDLQEIVGGTAPDADANGIPDICEAPTCRDADLSIDGQVNGADLAALLSQWGPANTNTASDVNHDGRVDGYDLSILLSFWGPCGP